MKQGANVRTGLGWFRMRPDGSAACEYSHNEATLGSKNEYAGNFLSRQQVPHDIRLISLFVLLQ
jgi:hypothetical protein